LLEPSRRSRPASRWRRPRRSTRWSRPTASPMSRPRKSRSLWAAAGDDMADPMKIRASSVGDSTEVKVLMSHEMETGQRKDAKGDKIIVTWVDNHGDKRTDEAVIA